MRIEDEDLNGMAETLEVRETLERLQELSLEVSEEIDEKWERVTSEMRALEAKLAMRRAHGYTPVHADWAEVPDAVHPSEWLHVAASVEQVRAAYRRYNVTFEVDAEGTLAMRLELPLRGPAIENLGTGTAVFRRQRKSLYFPTVSLVVFV